ncbi:MAG: type II toxin-antitoxin system VapC family toxin [Spirochaetaceae bacterium]|nr:type II toxin-antitoxin system VapC family toxin [Spirochaetaceae bacterium]
MILLDTNVLSEFTRRRPLPQVIAWHRQHEPLLALPTVALAELRFGIARLPEGRRKSSLFRFWTATRDHFLGRIFSFDERAAATYGDLAAAAERAGRPINVADGQIAAIARTHTMSVATRDVSDFEVTGISLVNPWDFIMPEPDPCPGGVIPPDPGAARFLL